MDRINYYKRFGWSKSPFIKSTSLDIPIIARVEEYGEVCESIGGWDRVMVLTAPIGYGKTTFMNQLIMEKPKGVKYVIAFNAYEPAEEVIGRIISTLPFWKRRFRNVDRTSFGEALQEKLGKDKMLLIFDESQDYEFELFKWLRILNDRCESLFMVFIGLGGLEDKITAEASFRDRKSRSIRLMPFENQDLEELVRQRIKWAGGGDIKPFTEGGIKRLCESSQKVPRLLLDNGQRVVEDAAKQDVFEIGEDFIERVLGSEKVEMPSKDAIEEVDDGGDMEYSVQTPENSYTEGYDFMTDLSPTQQEIVGLLMTHESLSISELSQILKKDIRSLGSLIRKLRGLNPGEVARKPKVPYPVIIRKGKETRVGRIQYVYTLSDNARRLLTRN